MLIGFTGTQNGTTKEQRATGREILTRARDGEFHHGDCIGSDAEFHDLAKECGLEPVIHPPSDPSKRAFKEARIIHPPQPYLVRNHNIVDSTRSLIATPGEYLEQQRSGTWATIRYARRLLRPICIIFPNGEITVENR